MHHDEVRELDAAHRRAASTCAAGSPAGRGRGPCAAATRARARPSRPDRFLGGDTSTGAPRSHAGPSVSRSPARCAAVTSGNSTGAASTSPAAAGPVASSAGAPSPRATTATGHSCTPSAPTSAATAASGKRVYSRGARPGGVGHREQLGEHRAGVPIDVPVPALAVAPAGAPRDAGDDEGGRVPARRRPDLHEGVVVRVVPVHARGQLHAVGHGDVDLEREAAARGPGGAEQPGRVRPLRRPHDPRGQVEQPGELRQVQLGGGDVRGAREHGDGRRRRGRQVAGERHARQRPRVPLEEPREAIEVVDLEVLHDARVVDGHGPHEIGVLAGGLVPAPRVGREPVQRLRRGLHGPSLPAFLDRTLGTYSPHADERRARRAVVEGRAARRRTTGAEPGSEPRGPLGSGRRRCTRSPSRAGLSPTSTPWALG